MTLGIEIEKEDDGRWIAEVTDLPGAMTYGATRESALAAAKALALRALADRLECGELCGEDFADIHFVPDAA